MLATILKKATEDVEYKPFKHNYRARLITSIVLVDEVPKNLLCKKVEELDFWNEISGWFHSNTRCDIPHPVIDTTNGSIEIPDDIDIRQKTIHCDSLSSGYFAVAGDHLVDKNYNVYVCYGWINSSGSSEIYFDFI